MKARKRHTYPHIRNAVRGRQQARLVKEFLLIQHKLLTADRHLNAVIRHGRPLEPAINDVLSLDLHIDLLTRQIATQKGP